MTETALLPTVAADRAVRRRLTTIVMEAAALAHGASTMRLRPQTFLARTPDGTTAGFQAARSTTVSHARLTAGSSRPRRRARLRDAGLTVPRAVVLDVEDVAAARVFAAQCPDGVLVKSPARSKDDGTEFDVHTGDSLDAELARQRTRRGTGARVLVEERIVGIEHRCTLIGGELIGAEVTGAAPTDSVRPSPRRLLGEQLGTTLAPAIRDAARRAAATVPGTGPLTVHLITPSAAGTDPADGLSIVSISAEIALRAGRPGAEAWTAAHARALVSDALPAGGHPGELQRPPVLRRQLRIEEVGAPERALAVLHRQLAEGPLCGQVDQQDTRTLVGTLEGTPGDLAAWSAALLAEGIAGHLPASVELATASDQLPDLSRPLD